MRTFDIRPQQFRVGDFLQWQRDGSLVLDPPFQRRSVWKPENRAFLLDTVIRGLPVPLIFIREIVDLDTQAIRREVVDGQQRLRSIFAFVDPSLLSDFDPSRDEFVVSEVMNEEIAEQSYAELDEHLKSQILEYPFAVDVLPTGVEDRDILEIFARLNSTGYKLNHQELRNAEFFGEFKTVMYRLAYEQLERWRTWKILSDDQISRMLEVQLVSDLVINIIDGLTGRSQARISSAYREYDADFQNASVVQQRFRRVMDEIDELLSADIANSVFSSEVHFFSLFIYLYDVMWGLGSKLDRRRATKLPTSVHRDLMELSTRFKTKDVPKNVLDSVERASTDVGRRRVRLSYMKKICGA